MAKNRSKADQRARVLVLGNLRGGEVRMAGGEMVAMSYTDHRALEAVKSSKIHALVLTGGSDVDPALYGAKRHPETQSPYVERDTVETLVLLEAAERGIPVLGICRGAQIMNATFGGTLHQHIGDLPGVKGRTHMGQDHRVHTAKGSRVRKAFGAEERWAVSIHHQAVDVVADGFVATGWARDGIVEAIESVEGWMVGVQFHPEMASWKPGMQELFDGLVAAAAKKAGMPAPKTTRASSPAPAPKPEYRPSQPSVGVPTRRDPLQRGWPSTVVTRYRCFRCKHGLQFDDRTDYVDHMALLHGIELQPAAASDRFGEFDEYDLWVPSK